MYITYIIIAFTVILSFWAFNNREVFIKCKHWPFHEQRSGEYYRWLTSGFIHADYMHLIFNMYALYIFGMMLENYYTHSFAMGQTFYLLLYVLAIIFAGIPTYLKHKNNPSFASIGASGAVSAVIFASILFNPWSGIGFMFIPIPIPGFVFGILYLAYTQWASRHSNDNIDHEAHLFGALFGIAFTIALKPSLAIDFVHQLTSRL